jgi:hypothetical protein
LFDGVAENSGASFVINVSDESEIKMDETLIVDDPFDRTVEFKTDNASTVEIPSVSQCPVPIPEPYDKLDALTIECTILKELINEMPSHAYPVPTPDPFNPLSAITLEFEIVRLQITERPSAVPGSQRSVPVDVLVLTDYPKSSKGIRKTCH